MKLAIISHTAHYRQSDQIVGWGPTVREINNLTKIFEKIYHIAVLHDSLPPPSALPYTSDKIKFIPLHPSGGKSILSKLSVIKQAPSTIIKVRQILGHVDYFQLRSPTGICNYLIPYLTLFSRKKGWYKYAGNWIQKNKPLGYAWQKFFLIHLQNRKVTINGKWAHSPSHLLSFENPCLTEGERKEGQALLKSKKNFQKIDLCFVGSLTDSKGVHRIIAALTQFKHPKLGTMHFVGDGPKRILYERAAKQMNCDYVFHGFLPKSNVNQILKKGHIFLFPTDSEGFPKAVAEAMNYGCLPIVSNVSSIGQYVKDRENGYLLADTSINTIVTKLREVFDHLEVLPKYLDQAWATSGKFTYDYYNQRILNELTI